MATAVPMTAAIAPMMIAMVTITPRSRKRAHQPFSEGRSSLRATVASRPACTDCPLAARPRVPATVAGPAALTLMPPPAALWGVQWMEVPSPVMTKMARPASSAGSAGSRAS